MPDCAGPATVVFDSTLTDYSFGPSHPMSPVRVDLSMPRGLERGVIGDRLAQVPAPMADRDLIATVHSDQLIEAVGRVGEMPGELDLARGLGTDDNPGFTDM